MRSIERFTKIESVTSKKMYHGRNSFCYAWSIYHSIVKVVDETIINHRYYFGPEQLSHVTAQTTTFSASSDESAHLLTTEVSSVSSIINSLRHYGLAFVINHTHNTTA